MPETPKFTVSPAAVRHENMVNALSWYEEQCRSLHRYLSIGDGPSITAAEAIIEALTLDAGNRAKAALS